MAKYAVPAQGLIANLLEMEEAQVESIKLTLPVKLTGGEDDAARAVAFYSTAGKLVAALSGISAEGRRRTLAERHNVAHLTDMYVQEICDSIDTQCWNNTRMDIEEDHTTVN